ncbi:diguanylate cyclase (GGDEF)-like protein [Anseongella ginsenosidimutans]|uniref:diguanylate cyclase n=1 Tax=Anseongella ginsenosidimutans TaxID=496056 RepID=A0A4R3KNS9_9SPHI|nr:GGDEF domain-containing protein [Anseongella ginsenosidimutans]QEC51976.1 GGDEF domain-containing protein [Anseongella ginsenosidimutans]TCS84765.1 diguanylate cyclase (GGDEF)-like protein [Anseongella ginsenosidimutans]
MKYIKDSFSKFKKDVLSNVFYDLMKYLFISFILVLILKFIPIAKEKLELDFSISIWVTMLCSLFLIGISFSISFFLFNSRFQKLQSQNRIDELTGLKNYKALELDLDDLNNSWVSRDEPISIILFDIDNFKKFNEDHNYEVADRLLTKLGKMLFKDSRITDETYRYFMRGDEFLIIARQTSISNAQIAAERKRKLIADTAFNIDGESFKLTVCCGVTEFNKGELKTDVLERVNQALQNAKKKPNKNCTEIIV